MHYLTVLSFHYALLFRNIIRLSEKLNLFEFEIGFCFNDFGQINPAHFKQGNSRTLAVITAGSPKIHPDQLRPDGGYYKSEEIVKIACPKLCLQDETRCHYYKTAS